MKDSLQESKIRNLSRAKKTASPAPESALGELIAGIARIGDELARIRELLEKGAGCDSKPAPAPHADAPAKLPIADRQAEAPHADAQEMIALDIDSFLKRH
jgi:hypothetical protein